MSVRPLVESDLPQVTDLYWRYMRNRQGSTPLTVQSSFRELYFANPFSDGEIPSLVYEGPDGRIIGFLGGTVRKMSVCGRTIKVVYYGNLVVEPDRRSGFAATHLLRALMATDHDMSMGDSANDISRKVLGRLGFRTIPALNIHWARPLLPTHYAVYALSRLTGPAISASLRLAMKPLCVLADMLAAQPAASPFRPTKSPLQGADADVATLLQCFVQFRRGYSMWPDYDAHSLGWLLQFIGRRTTRGQLRKIVLRDNAKNIVGWYIYYAKPGAIGEVVQIGGEHKHTKDILDHIFSDALEQGVIGLHGVLDRRQMPEFSDKGCFFTCRGGWTMAYSQQPELLDILHRGDVFLSRLDGEWCLDPGE